MAKYPIQTNVDVDINVAPLTGNLMYHSCDTEKLNNLIESSIQNVGVNFESIENNPIETTPIEIIPNEPIETISIESIPTEIEPTESINITKKKRRLGILVAHKTQQPKKTVRFFPYEFIDLENDNLALYNLNVILFDYKLCPIYKFGHHSISFNYGLDYFAFFKRLGHTKYVIAKHIESKTIVGSIGAVLRKINLSNGVAINVWYITDLKIDREHRNNNLTIKFIENIYHRLCIQSKRCYFIATDSIKYIIDKLPQLKFQSRNLMVYLVNTTTMASLERYFECMFGKITYIESPKEWSIDGYTDIYHLCHQSDMDGINLDKVADKMIMFCIPESSPLVEVMDEYTVVHLFIITIYSRGMRFFDWHNIMTSML